MRGEGATALAVAAFGLSFVVGMQTGGSGSGHSSASNAAQGAPEQQAQVGLGTAAPLPQLVEPSAAPKTKRHAKPRSKPKRRPVRKPTKARAPAPKRVSAPAPRPVSRPAPVVPRSTPVPQPRSTPAPVRPRSTPRPRPTPVPTFDDHGNPGSGTFDNGGGP